MKKVLLTISLALLGLGAFAQTADQFYPGWYYQVQGGAGYTAGESTFSNLISPAAAVGVGYQFTPVTSLRGVLTGWQAKGALPAISEIYKFNYTQLHLDGVFDICNMFGHKSTRLFNPYVLAGIGLNLRFNNDEAQALSTKFPTKNLLWDNPVVCFSGRVGAGLEIRLVDGLDLTLEVTDNVLSDNFNSKYGDALNIGDGRLDFDYQLNALAGLKFSFGQAAKRKAALAAAEAAAAEAAAKAAADKAAAEKAAAEKAAAEAAAAKAAADKAAAEAAAAKAAAEAAVRERSTVENIYFNINKSNINDSEVAKIDNIIRILKKYPDATVAISGYADKATGTAKRNMTLSQERSAIVKQALVEAGISESRITTAYYGDTEQVSDIPELNRVAVVVTK